MRAEDLHFMTSFQRILDIWLNGIYNLHMSLILENGFGKGWETEN